MARVAVFIDGFNVYHALDGNPAWGKFKWLDYAALARCYIGGRDTLVGVYLFTSLATWNNEKVKRHMTYLRALRTRGVEVIMGKFKRKDRICRATCKQAFQTFEEKLTDVNIAVRLFKGAYLDEYDRAILITGDTDIVPAVRAVRELFVGKQIGVVVPIGRRSEELKRECDFHFRIREEHLRRCQLPDVVDGGPFGELRRPDSWK